MDITQIGKCDMVDCVYNANRICHTPAINVGPHAECNTYYHGSSNSGKAGFAEVKGGIGACLASDCKFNQDLECKALNINVDSHAIHADCGTFQPAKQSR